MMRALLVLLVSTAEACGSGGGGHAVDGGPDAPLTCGNGVKDPDEVCDGADLGGATCASATAPGWVGALTCAPSCAFNVAGCNPPQTTWTTFTDAANWATFDISSLFPGAKGFISTVFDGRYMYFVPNNNGAVDGIVARYDTQAGLGASSSWATFDVATVSAAAKGFQGGAFDGRYVYLVPYSNGAFDGVFARYDTQADFSASASWTTFDLTTVDSKAAGYTHAAFDGRYIYFGPNSNAANHGRTARYDTHGAGFSQPSAWTTFDLATIKATAKGFPTVRYDGRYVYFGQYNNGTTYGGLVARYDTQSSEGYAAAGSWKLFDVSTVNAHAVGFYGSEFDGRYLYLIQYYDGAATNYGGYVARYDTTMDVALASAWTVFNVASVNANARGFIGGEFDGRYLYLVPHHNEVLTANPLIVRYDTQAGFRTATSWSVFNTTSVNAAASGFRGGGFDGEYIYLAPNNNGAADGVLARFDTKTPLWLPLGWNAAFE